MNQLYEMMTQLPQMLMPTINQLGARVQQLWTTTKEASSAEGPSVGRVAVTATEAVRRAQSNHLQQLQVATQMEFDELRRLFRAHVLLPLQAERAMRPQLRQVGALESVQEMINDQLNQVANGVVRFSTYVRSRSVPTQYTILTIVAALGSVTTVYITSRLLRRVRATRILQCLGIVTSVLLVSAGITILTTTLR